MNFIESNSLTEEQKKEIITLWNNEYPKKLVYKNIAEFEQYLSNLDNKNHILLLDENDLLKGWFMYFERNNDTWFAVIMDSSLQGQGLGTKFLNHAKSKNEVLNGWVIDHNKEMKQNGEAYISPVKFYSKNNFKILADNILEYKEIKGIVVRWEKTQTNTISSQ